VQHRNLQAECDPLIYTIIISNNRRDDLLACLVSLRAAGCANQRVCVLDNGSTDGSVEAIRALFPEVEVIVLRRNLGYAGNNNVGIVYALYQGADWIFLLNDDTILAPGCISTLLELGQNDPGVGAVGPLVLHYDDREVIQSAGGMMDGFLRPTHLAANQPALCAPTEPGEVDWISGCALLVRAAAVREAGLMDERYFLYWEETEWCLRIREAGWRIVMEPRARLWHKGVQVDYRPAPHVAYYFTRNRLLTLAKHHASLGAWLVAYTEILRTLASYTVRRQWRPQRAHRDAMWAGFVDFHRGRFGARQAV